MFSTIFTKENRFCDFLNKSRKPSVKRASKASCVRLDLTKFKDKSRAVDKREYLLIIFRISH